MSILKSILHRYNTTSQDYDTLHPETEYAQVTDFGQGTIAHLISSALASTVTACSTGSVFGKLVEKLLDASGMRYNFTNSNAWYICLGSLFGGLIIQGGAILTYESQWVSLPLSFPKQCLGVWCEHQNSATDISGDYTKNWEIHEYLQNQFWLECSAFPITVFWLVIGK